MYESLLNFFNWIVENVSNPIRDAFNDSRIINNINQVLNKLLNRLLGLFNNTFDNYNYFTNEVVSNVIGITIAIIALSLIIRTIKIIINSILQWVSGDTIIITNVRDRRKNKKASKR